MKNAWLDGQFEQLAGRVEVAAGPSWQETALADHDVFELSLRDAGLSDKDVQDALQERDEVVGVQKQIDEEINQFWATTNKQYFTDPPEVEELYRRRLQAGERLANFFKGRSFRVDEVAEVLVRIPLFILSAAGKTGCTAQFAIGRSTAAQADWTVTVFGTGLGGGGIIKASADATFTCASGETKVVFAPVTMPVEKLTLLEKGRPVRQGWRIDASRLQKAGAPGIRLLPRESVVVSGPVAEKYPLRDDQSGAIASYSYKYEASSKIGAQIGLKASGVDLSLKSQVELGQSVTLNFGLRGGFDYQLHLVDEGQGVVWA